LPVWQKKPPIAAGHSFPEGFRDEANRIFKALHRRIQRENLELHPLAEEI
jgi:hypothetical protein